MDDLPDGMTEAETLAAIHERLDFHCSSCGAHGSSIEIAFKPPAPPRPESTVVTIGDQEEIATADKEEV